MSDIQKYQTHEIVHANNAVKLTNKLLAIANVELIPYRKGNKWGFCTSNKRIVISCIYEEVTLYDNELAAVRLNNKWGFINRQGCVVIECIYEEVTLFYEEIVAVKLNDKWGFINKQGYVVIQFIYDGVKRERFIDGLLVVTKDTWKIGVIDMKGNLIVPCIYVSVIILDGLICVYKYIGIENDYDYGFYNKHGKLLTSKFYHYAQFYNFKPELTYSVPDGVRIVESGYFSKKGIFIDASRYQCHKKFSNGLAAVQFNDKWGFININGDVVIDFIYYETDSFFGENTFALKNGTYRLINRVGQEVFRFNDHIKISSAEYGYFTFEESHVSRYGGVDKKHGVLDNNGNIVVKAIYDEQLYFYNGYAETYNRKQNEKGITDIKGLSYFITQKYQHIFSISNYSAYTQIPSGLFYAILEDKYGILDNEGNEISQFIYSHHIRYWKDYITVCIYNKHGLLDKLGRIIIPCKYDKLYLFEISFQNGISQKLAKVHLNDKVGFLGLDGTEYWEG